MLFYDEFTLAVLKQRMPEYLEKTCGITDLRRPFRCLNPSHEDKHPSMSFDARTSNVRCFSCGAGGDVFDVAGWVEGVEAFPEKVGAVARAVGFPLQPSSLGRASGLSEPSRKASADKPMPLDGINLIDGMQRAIWTLLEEPQGGRALDYLRSRRFDDALIADSFVGWVEHPSELFPSMRAQPCDAGYIVLGFPHVAEPDDWVTFPYAVFRPCGNDEGPKELKPPGLAAPLWREYLFARTGDGPLYVTEGVFDAMSLTALLGAQACALCGTSGVERLLQVVRQVPRERIPRLVLALDSDSAGEAMAQRLSEELEGLGVEHSIAPPYPCDCKDANEYLILERGRHE